MARRSGFTLVEMAVALIIIGLVILAVFPALMAMRAGSQRGLTQSNLQALMTATAAYAQANGCLPCPTPASAIGNGFGRVRGDASAAPPACGICSTAEGIPPFASLGVPAAVAHDGGGHWITMRVDPALTINFGIAPPAKPVACACSAPASGTCTATSCSTVVNGICTGAPIGCACGPPVNNVCAPLPMSISQQGLCEPSGTGPGLLSKANSIAVQTPGGAKQTAAVLFVSHGANGYGSFYANPVNGAFGNGWTLTFPPGTASCGVGGYAECNSAATNSPLFYDAPPVTGGSAAYDDMLAYVDRNTLVSMLGNGSCQTVW
jgi:prepilin-type N-terminal cleavage/methylation domain-containing protein